MKKPHCPKASPINHLGVHCGLDEMVESELCIASIGNRGLVHIEHGLEAGHTMDIVVEVDLAITMTIT